MHGTPEAILKSLLAATRSEIFLHGDCYFILNILKFIK
jgi:hypothetical protein